MRTQFTASGGTHSSSTAASYSSTSSAADRRLNALVRHFGIEDSTSAMADLSSNPTSASNGDSVFAHVVRAPEDPILGVLFFISLSLSRTPFLFLFCCFTCLSYIP